MYAKEIQELYKKIPASKCKAGCLKCCINMIQFSPSEEKMMGGYEWNGQCPHLRDGICSVYNNRPLVCRIYGTSELLPCEDCTPERMLSDEETTAIIREYTGYRNKELERITNR